MDMVDMTVDTDTGVAEAVEKDGSVDTSMALAEDEAMEEMR